MSEVKTLDDVKAAFRQLGLEFGADEYDVKKEFRKLALKEHPDRNHGDEDAAAKRFKKVSDAKELLDEYAKNPSKFRPGLFQSATRINPFDMPSGANVRSESFASGNSRGVGARYYGADGEELFPLPGGGFARVHTAGHPGTSGPAERSFREGHSASRSGGHREGRRGSSSSEDFEIREDGRKYVFLKPRDKKPEHTPHKKKGSDGKHREGRQGSSSSHRTEVREDGNTYVELAPTRRSTEPAVSTSHKKKGDGDKSGKKKLYLEKNRKTGELGVKKK